MKGTCSGSHSEPGVKPHMDLMCLGSQARLLLCSMPRCCHPQNVSCETASLKGRKCNSKKDPKMSHPPWAARGGIFSVEVNLDKNP